MIARRAFSTELILKGEERKINIDKKVELRSKNKRD